MSVKAFGDLERQVHQKLDRSLIKLLLKNSTIFAATAQKLVHLFDNLVERHILQIETSGSIDTTASEQIVEYQSTFGVDVLLPVGQS